MTQHTLPNLTQITPTQPKTQAHSTQSKHPHTPTQPKTHPHSHTDKTHPHTHTPTQPKTHPHSLTVSVWCLSGTPPLPHSVRPVSVRCPTSLLLSVLPASVHPPAGVRPPSSGVCPHGVCPFVTVHHDVVTFNDGVLDQTMVHERTYIMPP